MSSTRTNPTARSAEAQDLELFTTHAADPMPDRHPSILRPGGHASPLKYPTALMPGAGRQTRTPSPNASLKTPSQQSPFSPPYPVAYKAYSPPRMQSSSDDLSANIEGYFSTLEVAPLNIRKTKSSTALCIPPSLPPKEEIQVEDDWTRRCISPPVPPKERIEDEHHNVSPISELEAPVELEAPARARSVSSVVSPMSESGSHADQEHPPTEPPPAYDESERVTPPPEKAAHPRRSGNESLAGSAAASAAQVGSSVAGIHAAEAIEASSSNLTGAMAKKDGKDEHVSTGASAAASTAVAVPPPPPRQELSVKGKGKGRASPSSSTPPASSPSAHPHGTSPAKSNAPSFKAGGAAATHAANVGAAVAGLGQSAAVMQARKVLEKRLGHILDKAKEHHQQLHQYHQHKKEQHIHARKPSCTKGKKNALEPRSAPRGGAEDSYLAMKAEGDYLYA